MDLTPSNRSTEKDERLIYDFRTPLWDRYFRETRRNVRFPRNYREMNPPSTHCPTC
jgi:hypothetical protein